MDSILECCLLEAGQCWALIRDSVLLASQAPALMMGLEWWLLVSKIGTAGQNRRRSVTRGLYFDLDERGTQCDDTYSVCSHISSSL